MCDWWCVSKRADRQRNTPGRPESGFASVWFCWPSCCAPGARRGEIGSGRSTGQIRAGGGLGRDAAMQVRDAMRRCRRAGAGHASHQAAGGLDWELDGGLK